MISRRAALQIGAGVAVAACTKGSSSGGGAPAGPLPGAPQAGEVALPAGAVMPTRLLGRTGEKVSLLGLGGFHMGAPKDEQESLTIVRYAIDHGVTFMDNCWDYNDGLSETRMGAALRDGYRDKVFLMTKLDGRTRSAANAQLEQSLKRLQTDRIDLVQIHEVIRMDDPDRCFAPGGAIEALVDAKKAGKIRYIGFTGHKSPAIHLHMLETAKAHGFTFDTVQMPINVMDPHYESFEKNVLPVLLEQQIGVLGMKPLAGGLLVQSEAVLPRECLQYAMTRPVSVTITGCDSVGVLEQALDVAYRLQPLSNQKVQEILAHTADVGATGRLEQFKTSDRFDGTAKHPKWLESATL